MTNSKLQKWVKVFHSLTFDIENEFKDIYSYKERLNHFKDVFQKKVKKYRKAFLYDYARDKALRRAYAEYMQKNYDYILFVNTGVSAPDQRKFDGGDFIPFTAYWYQVVIWELYNHFTIAYWKSRDIGLSFAINSGEAMSLVLDRGDEVFYMSRIRDDVDKSFDRTNSNMGRVRQIIEAHPLYTMKNFYRDVFLNLYSSTKTGIMGNSTSANPARSKRGKRAFVDEAGAIKQLMEIVQSVSMSAKYVGYAGTLKIGSDAGFRQIIKEGYRIDPRKIFNNFKEHLKACEYREAWNKTIDDLKKEVPEGKALSFTNTYKDHPLKAGNCDYIDIEKNRLLNDEVIIAHELLADLNAGSPDRSFYSMNKNHFDKIKIEGDLKDYEVLMGFDPGSHGTAALIPLLIDHYGYYYILPAEYFNKGSMNEWIDKMIMKYGRFTLFAEESVRAYSKAGAGWLSVFRHRDIDTIIVSNRHIEDQLMVVNEVLRRKIIDNKGNESYKVIIDEANEWWGMSYISGEKYRDVRQREMSHPAEAFIAIIFELNKDILDGVRNGISYG